MKSSDFFSVFSPQTMNPSVACVFAKLSLRNVTSLRTAVVSLSTEAAASIPTHSSSEIPFALIQDAAVDTVSATYRERHAALCANLEKHQQIVKQAHDGGGERARERHVKRNKKWLVRQRLSALLDVETAHEFLEVGTIAGHDMDYGDVPGAGTVVGIGRVRGVLCVIGANDATVKGGTVYPIGVQKTLRGQELSAQLRLPMIQLIDSGGAFLPLQADIFPDAYHGGRTFYNQAVLGASGCPQIALVCGSCTAGAAYIPTMSDDAIMIDKTASVFLAGPPLVRAALGEVIDAENLGGATVHCRVSGCADYFAQNEAEAFEICRDAVSSLGYTSSASRPGGAPLYSTAELDGLSGSPAADESGWIERILARIVDGSRVAEFRKLYGDAFLACFAYLGGHLVGILADRGTHAQIDRRSYEKATQFVRMCTTRKIPLICLQNSASATTDDQTSEADTALRLKACSQLMSAVACAVPHIPRIVLLLGDASGINQYALGGGRCFDASFVFAWPGARLLPDDLADERAGSCSAVEAAANLWIDDVIRPRDTRDTLVRALTAALDSRQREMFDDSEAAVLRM